MNAPGPVEECTAVVGPPEPAYRFAILNAHWPVHSSVGYITSWLEQAGCAVDVFVYDSDTSLSGDLVKETAAVRLFSLDEPASSVAFKKKSRRVIPQGLLRIYRTVRDSLKLKLRPEQGLVKEHIVQAVTKEATQRPYTALIGVEKGGLIWAAEVAARTNTPLVYYSLELYTRDHPWVTQSSRQKRFKAAEAKYHSSCALTIVQDQHRGRALLADNGVGPAAKMAYLPVSVTGSPISFPSQWLHKELGLPSTKVLILSYGAILEQRPCVDLAEAAQSFPEEWRLVLHGYGQAEVLEKIRRVNERDRVCLSLRLVPVEERELIIRSAHIGLALYYGKLVNDRLTGRSSEKIALYLQCGLPVIAFRHPSYEHLASEGAAVLIDSLDQLSEAVATILKDYPLYSQNAYACYQRHYCFDTNFQQVFEQLTTDLAGSQNGRINPA